MAAIYFFFVKPALDTTTDAIHSISAPIQQAEQQANQAQNQLQQQAQHAGQNGNTGVKNNTLDQVAKLQACVQGAGKNTAALTECAAKFAPH